MKLRHSLICCQLLAWATALCRGNAESVGNIVEGEDGETHPHEQDYSEVKFIYYTSNSTTPTSLPINQVDDLLNFIDVAKHTVFYAHGFTESQSSESVVEISEAFLQRGSHNFVLVDWSRYAGIPYIAACRNVPWVGKAVGKAVDSLVQKGLCSDNLWFIGHSLGAHVAGAVAQAVGFTWKRVSGLDPAGPGFSVPLLTRQSAEVVDVIHTDAGVLGYSHEQGSVDFWPNGGSREQPGCHLWETDLIDALGACSHQRSWQFFAESVVNDQAFPAVLCSSVRDLQRGLCPPNDTNIVYLGYAAPEAHIEGSAYLITSPKSPFGLGMNGIDPAG